MRKNDVGESRGRYASECRQRIHFRHNVQRDAVRSEHFFDNVAHSVRVAWNRVRNIRKLFQRNLGALVRGGGDLVEVFLCDLLDRDPFGGGVAEEDRAIEAPIEEHFEQVAR